MPSALQNLPDVTTFAANIAVFLGATAAAVAGSFHAVKKVKLAWIESMKEGDVKVTKTQVIGGLLQDQYGSAMMAEALRDLRHTLQESCVVAREGNTEMRELRHEVERLIDRLDRNVR